MMSKPGRLLGLAFVLQFVTSLGNGALLKPLLIVEGDAAETLRLIAAQPGLWRAHLMIDVLTALGIVFLGAMLYLTLREHGEKVALTGLGFYIFEAALLGASKGAGFQLLGLSQAYAAGGPDSLLLSAELALASMDYVGSALHMLAFSIGAILFYALLVRSRVVPLWLSLWGTITVIPCLLGTMMLLLGGQPSMVLYAAYVPFELVIGVWLLIVGTRAHPPRPAPRVQSNEKRTEG